MKRKIFWIILAFVIVVSLLALPASAQESSLTVPQKGSALRQLVVQYAQEMAQVEALVNEQIAADLPVITDVMSIDEAKKLGAMALFGEMI